MRQYGLMDGRGDKLRLTDRAFRILESPDAEEVAQALDQAAYTPPLFAEIHANKPDSSDEAVAYWLRREKGFSSEGASKAVRAYRETTAMVGLAPPGYNSKDDNPKLPADLPKKAPPQQENRQQQNLPGASRHNVTGLLLEGGTIADVGFSGQPLTQEGVAMLIEYLALLKRALPPSFSAAPPASTVAAPASPGLPNDHPFRHPSTRGIDRDKPE
jgi:hypothetical protein